MLQDIRANAQGTVAKVIVGLIVIAFAFFGIESILLGGGGNAVAEVNGDDITPQELQQAVNTRKRQLLAMMGDDINADLLDDQLLTQQAIQTLIQRKLLVQSAQEMGLSISDTQVGAIVGSMEQFKLDGQFSAEMYRARLSEAGFTPGSFKRTITDDLLMGQARSGLAATEFATPAEMTLSARIAHEQRDLRYLTIPVEGFREGQQVSDAEVEQYYADNPQQFLATEAVILCYIELRAEDFRQPVDEQLVLEAYETEKLTGQYATENRVSHILFEQGADESEEAFAQRIVQVQARLGEGADFAQLAGEFSDDIGSSNFGGELGLSRGDTFPEEMEKAIAAMDVGEVSAPVVTEAGTHLILLQERREGKAPDLEELRPRLEEQIALAEARVELLRTVETLKDLAFNADNLSEPAAELELEVSRSERIVRDQTEGLFANSALLAAAFSDDVLTAGHNSDVIELDSDTWVALRVREHFPAEVMPLEAVRGQILTAVADAKARAAVEAAAKDAVASLRGNKSVEALATEAGYAWQVELGADRRNPIVPQEVLAGAFRLAPPGEGNPVIDYVIAESGDAMVYEVARVTPGDLTELAEIERQLLQQQVSGEYGQLIDNEYRLGLRDGADINVL